MNYALSNTTFIVPSNVRELSSYNFCTWLDHYIFRDTSLSPTGYDFFYPLTAYGGPLSGGPINPVITYDSVVSGGPLADTCYQDFCYQKIELTPVTIYCITTVNFVLTALDDSVSDIIKIVYDFGDGSPIFFNDYKAGKIDAISPKNIIVSHDYYPTEKVVTTFTASISVLYNNCCINTYTNVLCSYRCGILDMYEDTYLLDATQSKDSNNIIFTMENLPRRQIFDNVLDLNEPVPYLSALPNVLEPVPQVEPRITLRRGLTAQRVRRSPIKPPIPTFIYIEGPGIDLNPNAPELLLKDQFIAIADTSGITLSSNSPTTDHGAPYLGGPGIIIQA